MAKPLRVGVAGLGVVGLSLVASARPASRAISPRAPAATSSSPPSARAPNRDRGVDLGEARFFADPRELAAAATSTCSSN